MKRLFALGTIGIAGFLAFPVPAFASATFPAPSPIPAPAPSAAPTPALAAAPALATPVARLMVVTLDGTSIEDWMRADTFHLRRAVTEGTSGLLSTRTARPPGQLVPGPPGPPGPPAGAEATCVGRAGDALATMLRGVRSTSADLNGSEPLRVALAGAGISMGLPVPVRADSAFPTGRRADLERVAAGFRVSRDRFIMLRIPDTLAADCAGGTQRDRWVGIALGRADAILGVLRASLQPNDRLIVLSGVAPWRSEREKNFLAAATIEDPNRRGNAILTSPGTRRRGVVSLTDFASTVTHLFGIDQTVGVGRAWQPAGGTAASVRRAARDFAHASALRSPLMRSFVWGSVAICALAALMVLAGRGRARGGRIPRTFRDWLAFGLTVVVATPFAIAVEPLAGLSSTGAALALIGSVACAVAVAAAAARGLPSAPGIAAACSAAGLIAFLGDGELGARSALSFSVAGGDRFYGVGNEMMGVAVAGLLIALAHRLDRRPADAKWAIGLGIFVAGAVAAPVAGAKFGSLFVTVPAFGLFAVRVAGRRVTRELVLGLAIATVLAAGVFAAWDLLSAPGVQSHIARAAADTGTPARKLAAAARLAAGSFWTAGIAIPAAIATMLLRRRAGLLARGLWSRPALRAALWACVVAGGGSIVFNDAGIVAASFIGIVGGAALLHALLIGQAPPPHPTERMRRLKEFAS